MKCKIIVSNEDIVKKIKLLLKPNEFLVITKALRLLILDKDTFEIDKKFAQKLLDKCFKKIHIIERKN